MSRDDEREPASAHGGRAGAREARQHGCIRAEMALTAQCYFVLLAYRMHSSAIAM
jgi:hypothetical protein